MEERNKTILIVDNDTEMSQSLSTALRTEGYNVETARQLGEVLEKTVNSQVSLIVVNLERDGLPDIEVISMIKKLNSSIPIITFTEDDSIETERRIRQEKVFFYFVKPFMIEDMKAVIKSAIGTGKNEKF